MLAHAVVSTALWDMRYYSPPPLLREGRGVDIYEAEIMRSTLHEGLYSNIILHFLFTPNCQVKIIFSPLETKKPRLFFFFFVFLGLHQEHTVGCQAGGQVGAIVAGLCHSHSNEGSELCLRPTPELTATPNP